MNSDEGASGPEESVGTGYDPPITPDHATERSRSSSAPPSSEFGVPRAKLWDSLVERTRQYFLGADPTFWVAMVPALVLSALLYTRSVSSNFIFDEQEALLANPYVNGKGLSFWSVIHRDFWGLPPDRSVGSYRPFPNVVWRLVAAGQRGLQSALVKLTRAHSSYALSPWVFHWVNVVVHAANGALLVCLVFHVTRRRGLAWLAGTIFIACAVLTEAVSGVVGAADVWGGMGALLALAALRLPIWAMPLGVAGGMLLGLFSKESALVCVPLVPLAALFLGPYFGRRHPRTLLRCALSAVATVGAFLLYVKCRKIWFPTALPPELEAPLSPTAGRLARAARWFLVWFHQPSLPKDPLNNPLVQADMAHRIAGALRVYWRGLVQIVFPRALSGDYSFPQEPVPDRLFTVETVLGGLAMIAPPIIAVVLWLRSIAARARVAARARERLEALGFARADDANAVGSEDPTLVPNRALAGVGVTPALVALSLIWAVISYFPHSNIPVLLPTVRAERFWYFPAMGTS
ncbi:MAG TPA: tetratricopeptide repeat protein, partial [Polyangiaceae bacterium]